MNAIDLYSIAIGAEEVTRKTDVRIEPPTLDNIFDEKRNLSIKRVIPPLILDNH